ncbi:flagellar export protein FliJ [Catenovulum agarivorans]|uniref:flagellar export protein FliJ n=1 Tax=Catenovulum agarivorans TaxID=1172192 RepID=UPI000311345D|nr:flagellar export protein FliJ [Catenovulum agarivorans]
MNKQLQLVADIEKRKEDDLALKFAQAKQDLQKQHEKLAGLEQFQRDYMTTVIESGKKGLSSSGFQRLQSFISQLDLACSQQRGNITKAEKVVEQRRALWLQQQRKRKSIEAVIEKQQKKHALHLQRQEQTLADEFANNMAARLLQNI